MGGLSGGAGQPFESTEQTITQSGSLTIAHGLGEIPKSVTAHLICKTAENGYGVGDEVEMLIAVNRSVSDLYGMRIEKNATNILVQFCSATNVFTSTRGDNSTVISMTNAKWKLVIKAFK